MCDFCDEDGPSVCQFCSCPVCFDVEPGDDFIRPACVTAGGDLACNKCAAEVAAEEALEASEYDYYDYGDD